MAGEEQASWALLETELDAWSAVGREAEIWWRDDDATAPAAALERLLDLSAGVGAPLALAVIPDKAEAGLVRLLDGQPAQTAVLQHGYAHSNHAAADAKKCELVSPAARPAVVEELQRGQGRLFELFGARFHPVMVPPWNRIAEDLISLLPGLGFTGLSSYRPRKAAEAAPGLSQVNCHLDILQWRPERRFLGTRAALDLLIGHLAAKRRGTADPAEPSGILSHHQAHDAAAWDFLAELLARLGRHPATALLTAQQAFTARPAGRAQHEAAG